MNPAHPLPLASAASSAARLLRTVTVLGWSAPRLASKIASARRISGSASARRFVALKQHREIVEADRHIVIIRAVACLVDSERATHQRFGFSEAVRIMKQRSEITQADRHFGVIGP